MKVEIELTNDVLLVQRVYPNLIDLFSDIGSIIKVLTFVCIATGILNNQIRFNQYIMNTILLPEYDEKAIEALS